MGSFFVVVVLIFKQPTMLAEMFTDEVMFESFIHITFSYICRLPHFFPEVIATGDQTKLTITLNKIADFSGFKHC